MKVTALARTWQAKVVAAFVAVAAVFGMMQLAPDANADRRILRPGCDWDTYQHWVQYCQVYSPAMDRNIPVHVQPGQGSNRALYLLDGLRSPEGWSDWIHYGNAPRTAVNGNINLVAVGGGAASFYSDWDRPALTAQGMRTNKWETFLTAELPVWLEQNFGIRRNNNAIAGLSMGASSALALAYNHPDMFDQVGVFSGYLHTSAPGIEQAISLAQMDAGVIDPTAMWGVGPTPSRIRNDPTLNIGKIRDLGLNVSVYSATGVPSGWNQPQALQRIPSQVPGIVLEGLSRASTLNFEAKARAAGLNAQFHYAPDGIHVWETWDRDFQHWFPSVWS